MNERLAPLLRELWVATIDAIVTEDEESGIWLLFKDSTELEKFTAALFPSRDSEDRLYLRAAEDEGEWGYEVMPNEERGPPLTFVIGLGLPEDDLPEVVTRMRRHNDAHPTVMAQNYHVQLLFVIGQAIGEEIGRTGVRPRPSSKWMDALWCRAFRGRVSRDDFRALIRRLYEDSDTFQSHIPEEDGLF